MGFAAVRQSILLSACGKIGMTWRVWKNMSVSSAKEDHSVLSDALIAATACEHQLSLCTANAKYYRVVTDLDIIRFRP